MSESPVLPLPPSYAWGFVVGRSIRAIADTDQDADRFPEARGSTGRVTFTPLVKLKKHLAPPTAFVHHEVVQARLFDGVLVDEEGHEGIYLITGVYQVSFAIDSGSIPSFPIEVLPEHTIENPRDLVTAAPYVPEPGEATILLEVPSGTEGRVLGWVSGQLAWLTPAEGGSLTWQTLPGRPLTFPPDEHEHPDYLTTDDLPPAPDLSGFVHNDDPRLSDARTPTAHDHPDYLTAADLPPAPPAPFLVLNAGQPVPPETPVGTLIFERIIL